MAKAKKKADVIPRHYDVVKSPIITEKATMASQHSQLVFRVVPSATKPQIKEAVEALYSVEVTGVNTLNQRGKTKKFRGVKGRRPHTKKAIVTLKEGQAVDVMTGV